MIELSLRGRNGYIEKYFLFSNIPVPPVPPVPILEISAYCIAFIRNGINNKTRSSRSYVYSGVNF